MNLTYKEWILSENGGVLERILRDSVCVQVLSVLQRRAKGRAFWESVWCALGKREIERVSREKCMFVCLYIFSEIGKREMSAFSSFFRNKYMSVWGGHGSREKRENAEGVVSCDVERIGFSKG